MDETRRPVGRLFWAAPLVVLLSIVTQVFASGPLQGPVDRLIRAADLGSSIIGLEIRDVETGAELASVNPEKPMIPASNMKLVTTAAGLDALGKDFKFNTELRLTDKDVLIVRGDGDAGFGDPELLAAMKLDPNKLVAAWVEAVKAVGVKKVEKLLVDDRVFDREFVHPNWPVNQLHKWYCAEVAGLSFNDNCLSLYAAPTKTGQPPTITFDPIRAPIQIDNSAVTGDKNAFWASRKPDTNTMILRGSVRHALTEAVEVTVHDPPLFFAGTLANRLRDAGVAVGSVERVDPQQVVGEGRVIAAVTTALPTYITRCNRHSQNLFAESLCKRLGFRLTGQPGSWASGAAAERAFLAKVLGTAAAEVVVDDGSGMSKNNRVSAHAFVKLLTYMHNQPAIGETYINSLARPGDEGTLEKRFTEVKVKGEVRAKTGYVAGVNCISGYLIHNDRTVAFSILVNECKKSPHDVRLMMDKIVAAVDSAIVEQRKEKHPALGG
jgi:D-alanyl-D-alanine carboxypeptidase/D-alanyl-D-alanine-endopeptidase (penicillin-binding protein 4)